MIEEKDLDKLLDLNTPNVGPSGVDYSADVFSTIVELEFQYMTDENLDIAIFTSFLKTFVVKQAWVDNKIWTNPGCLEDGVYCRIQRK